MIIAPVAIATMVEHSGSSYLPMGLEGPFTTAGNIAGLDKLAKWTLQKPDTAHRLLRLTTDFLKSFVDYWLANFPAEKTILREAEPSTSNQVISPRIFKGFALPYLQELNSYAVAKGIRHVFCHVCGEQNLNLPFWKEVPFGQPGIVSIGHEVDIETASLNFPKEIILGNVKPPLLQTGTPEEVYEEARLCIQKGRKHGGGYILAAGCELPPKSPSESVLAMLQGISDYAWYS